MKKQVFLLCCAAIALGLCMSCASTNKTALLEERSRGVLRDEGIETLPMFTIAEDRVPWVPGQILVKFKDNVTESLQLRVRQRFGLKSVRSIFHNRIKVVRVKKDLMKEILEKLSRDPSVEYAEPNYKVYPFFIPNDTYYANQWHMNTINAEEAWDVCRGSGVTVAVVDSGVYSRGSDGFGGRLLSGYNAIIGMRGSAEDSGYHGTHVAGTVAQATNNTRGCAGVAFGARILPVKVLGSNGGTAADVAEGIVWAVDNGADIINLSLGSKYPSRTGQHAIGYAYRRGVTVIAATGNDGEPAVSFPAAYDHVIGVGAIASMGSRTSYSNYGPQVDIVAPGGTKTQGVVQETYYKGRWGYYGLSGTSMASPHVAGVAALIKSLQPMWGPDQIESVLKQTATDLGPAGRDNYYGYGLVDAQKAVAAAKRGGPGNTPSPDPSPSKPDPGMKVNLYNDLRWSSGRSLKATLATSEGMWETSTGSYSSCKAVSGQICDIKVYLDGRYYGTFTGCLDPDRYCGSAAAMVLGLNNWGNLSLSISCQNSCSQWGYRMQTYEGGERFEMFDADEMIEFGTIDEEAEDLSSDMQQDY